MESRGSMENLYRKEFILDANDVDFKSEMSIPAVMRHFQAMAAEHAQIMGMDYFTLKAKSNAFWVITKVKLKINSFPRWGEKVELRTWPLLPALIKCNRDFELSDENGNVLMQGMSEWCILDMETKRPRKVSTTCYPLEMEHLERRALAEEFSQIKPEFENLVYERPIRTTDIDLNMHTNNTVYSNLIFDAFSISELGKIKIKSYEIHFCSESREKDVLYIFRTDSETNTAVAGRDASEKRIFQAQMEYETRSD